MDPTRLVPVSSSRRIILAVACLMGIGCASMSAASVGPALTLTLARASSTVFAPGPAGPVLVPFVRQLTDRTPPDLTVPKDTIPSRVLLEFVWHAEPVPPATAIVGYEYRFGWQPSPVSVGPEVVSLGLDTSAPDLMLGSGFSSFQLRARDDLGGAPMLALHGFQPNPAVGDGTIAFSLPDDRPVTLELFDTSGRRVWSTRTAPGPGPHNVRLHRSLAPGVYVVKLSHGGQVRLARAALLR